MVQLSPQTIQVLLYASILHICAMDCSLTRHLEVGVRIRAMLSVLSVSMRMFWPIGWAAASVAGFALLLAAEFGIGVWLLSKWGALANGERCGVRAAAIVLAASVAVVLAFALIGTLFMTEVLLPYLKSQQAG